MFWVVGTYFDAGRQWQVGDILQVRAHHLEGVPDDAVAILLQQVACVALAFRQEVVQRAGRLGRELAGLLHLASDVAQAGFVEAQQSRADALAPPLGSDKADRISDPGILPLFRIRYR